MCGCSDAGARTSARRVGVNGRGEGREREGDRLKAESGVDERESDEEEGIRRREREGDE